MLQASSSLSSLSTTAVPKLGPSTHAGRGQLVLNSENERSSGTRGALRTLTYAPGRCACPEQTRPFQRIELHIRSSVQEDYNGGPHTNPSPLELAWLGFRGVLRHTIQINGCSLVVTVLRLNATTATLSSVYKNWKLEKSHSKCLCRRQFLWNHIYMSFSHNGQYSP
jgi:hypothetical protein